MKTNHSRSLSILLAIATSAFALSGCVAQNEEMSDVIADVSDTDEQEETSIEPTADVSTDGLTIETSTNDRVAGIYEHNGVAIRFDLSRDELARHARITFISGEPIVDATLQDGIESSVFLGGKARVTGAVHGGEPTTEGDADVFDVLNGLPEASLVPELKEALIAQGIDEDLFLDKPLAKKGAGTQQDAFDGVWHHLWYGETAGFFSWGFYTTTTVIIAREEDPSYGYVAGWFQAGFAAREYVGGYGTRVYYRKWWGAWVTVGNNLLPVCSPDGWCQNTAMIMRHF